MARAGLSRIVCAAILSRPLFERIRGFRHRLSLEEFQPDISRHWHRRPRGTDLVRTSANEPLRTRRSPAARALSRQSIAGKVRAATSCVPPPLIARADEITSLGDAKGRKAYSAAIWRGAGGGLARSAANWA